MVEPLWCPGVSLPSFLHVNSGEDAWIFSTSQFHIQPHCEFSFGLLHPLYYKCKALTWCLVSMWRWINGRLLILLVKIKVIAWIFFLTPGFFLSLTSLLSSLLLEAFSTTSSGSLSFLLSPMFYSSPLSYTSFGFSFTLIPLFSCSVLIFLSSSLSLFISPLFPLPISLLYPSFLLIPFWSGSFELQYQGQRNQVGIREECWSLGCISRDPPLTVSRQLLVIIECTIILLL